MKQYVISSTELDESGNESEIFDSVDEARQWVINHLDLSQAIEIVEIK